MKRILVLLAGMIAAAFFVAPAFATDPGFVEICKASGSPAVSGTFSFLINGEITATANAGECTAPIAVTGSEATIEETDYTDANGFSTDDYTAVSAISTSQPGAPNEALLSHDLAGRTATVAVAGGDESTATIVTFTNVLVSGYVEICKSQVTGAGLDGQSFSYTVQGAMGFAASANILVGSCSNPIYAPAGHVNITEGGPSAFVTSIATMPSDRLLDSDLAAGTATVAVNPAAPGAVSGESIVTYTNNSAQLKICKVAGDEALIGQSYSFSAGGGTYAVTAGSGAGHCVLAGRYRAGTSITVTEAPSAGQAVDSIAIAPASRSFVSGGSDFLGRSATLTLGPGETVITYTNVLATPGLLKICKAGAGTGLATFTVSGPRGTAPGITQGIDTVMVPVGGCALAPSSYPYAGVQTITETPMAGFSVSGITVADADRLVAGSVNLAGGSVGAYIGSGVTVATFTNAGGRRRDSDERRWWRRRGTRRWRRGTRRWWHPRRSDSGRHRVGRHCRDDVVDCQHDRRLCSEGCQGREEGLGRQGADRLPEVRPLRRRPRQRCDEDGPDQGDTARQAEQGAEGRVPHGSHEPRGARSRT